jgi:hypothetical protein
MFDRFEPTHTSFPDTGRLMGKLCPIVGVLLVVVNGIRDQLSVSDSIAS